jgi:hypothetical protein
MLRCWAIHAPRRCPQVCPTCLAQGGREQFPVLLITKNDFQMMILEARKARSSIDLTIWLWRIQSPF